MGILPPRPLPLDRRALTRRALRHAAMSILVSAVAIGFCVGAVYFGREIARERALWREGVPGRVMSVHGKVESTDFLFNDYNLDVDWADDHGVARSAKTSFLLTGAKVPAGVAPALRYDAADPSRIVLSWAAEGGAPRAALPVIMGVIGLLMLAAFPLMLREERRKLELLRLCAEDGEEVFPELLGLTVYKGTWTVRYRMPDDPKEHKAAGRDKPLVIDRDGAHRLLALRSPRAADRIHLVAADLAPFELSAEQRARILTR